MGGCTSKPKTNEYDGTMDPQAKQENLGRKSMDTDRRSVDASRQSVDSGLKSIDRSNSAPKASQHSLQTLFTKHERGEQGLVDKNGTILHNILLDSADPKKQTIYEFNPEMDLEKLDKEDKSLEEQRSYDDSSQVEGGQATKYESTTNIRSVEEDGDAAASLETFKNASQDQLAAEPAPEAPVVTVSQEPPQGTPIDPPSLPERAEQLGKESAITKTEPEDKNEAEPQELLKEACTVNLESEPPSQESELPAEETREAIFEGKESDLDGEVVKAVDNRPDDEAAPVDGLASSFHTSNIVEEVHPTPDSETPLGTEIDGLNDWEKAATSQDPVEQQLGEEFGLNPNTQPDAESRIAELFGESDLEGEVVKAVDSGPEDEVAPGDGLASSFHTSKMVEEPTADTETPLGTETDVLNDWEKAATSQDPVEQQLGKIDENVQELGLNPNTQPDAESLESKSSEVFVDPAVPSPTDLVDGCVRVDDDTEKKTVETMRDVEVQQSTSVEPGLPISSTAPAKEPLEVLAVTDATVIKDSSKVLVEEVQSAGNEAGVITSCTESLSILESLENGAATTEAPVRTDSEAQVPLAETDITPRTKAAPRVGDLSEPNRTEEGQSPVGRKDMLVVEIPSEVESELIDPAKITPAVCKITESVDQVVGERQGDKLIRETIPEELQGGSQAGARHENIEEPLRTEAEVKSPCETPARGADSEKAIFEACNRENILSSSAPGKQLSDSDGCTLSEKDFDPTPVSVEATRSELPSTLESNIMEGQQNPASNEPSLSSVICESGKDSGLTLKMEDLQLPPQAALPLKAELEAVEDRLNIGSDRSLIAETIHSIESPILPEVPGEPVDSIHEERKRIQGELAGKVSSSELCDGGSLESKGNDVVEPLKSTERTPEVIGAKETQDLQQLQQPTQEDPTKFEHPPSTSDETGGPTQVPHEFVQTLVEEANEVETAKESRESILLGAPVKEGAPKVENHAQCTSATVESLLSAAKVEGKTSLPVVSKDDSSTEGSIPATAGEEFVEGSQMDVSQPKVYKENNPAMSQPKESSVVIAQNKKLLLPEAERGMLAEHISNKQTGSTKDLASSDIDQVLEKLASEFERQASVEMGGKVDPAAHSNLQESLALSATTLLESPRPGSSS